MEIKKQMETSQIQATKKLKSLLEELKNLPYTKCAPFVLEIKKALQEGANIDTQDQEGDTLLHIAGTKNIKAYNAYINLTLSIDNKKQELYSLDIPTLVSSYKPNPFIKNNKGFTPSFVAASHNSTAECQMLLAYENAIQAEENGNAFQALNNILQGQQYKKVEQVVQMGDDSGIIERYHTTDHQPHSVIVAREKLDSIAKKLQGEIKRGTRQID